MTGKTYIGLNLLSMCRSASACDCSQKAMTHLAKITFAQAHILPVLILADDELGGVDLASVLRQCAL